MRELVLAAVLTSAAFNGHKSARPFPGSWRRILQPDTGSGGVLISFARNGWQFRQAAQDAGAPADRAEIVWELTYRARVTDWLSIQPNLQYVVNPGTDPALKNALVAALRFEFAFSR